MTIPLLSANTPPVVGGVLGAVMMLLESSGDHNKSCQVCHQIFFMHIMVPFLCPTQLSVDGVATKMQQFNIATLDSALSHRVATSLQGRMCNIDACPTHPLTLPQIYQLRKCSDKIVYY